MDMKNRQIAHRCLDLHSPKLFVVLSHTQIFTELGDKTVAWRSSPSLCEVELDTPTTYNLDGTPTPFAACRYAGHGFRLAAELRLRVVRHKTTPILWGRRLGFAPGRRPGGRRQGGSHAPHRLTRIAAQPPGRPSWRGVPGHSMPT